MGAGVICARCRRAEARPGRTRCAPCAALDSAEASARYWLLYRGVRGPWGGLRAPAPKLHMEREGTTVRITCRCGARLAGTWSEYEADGIVDSHRCGSRGRVRGRTGAQMTLEGR